MSISVLVASQEPLALEMSLAVLTGEGGLNMCAAEHPRRSLSCTFAVRADLTSSEPFLFPRASRLGPGNCYKVGRCVL